MLFWHCPCPLYAGLHGHSQPLGSSLYRRGRTAEPVKWNSALYDDSQSFISAYGESLVSLVQTCYSQRILDLGCGTGDLTRELSKLSDHVIGIDDSEDMIAAARTVTKGLQT